MKRARKWFLRVLFVVVAVGLAWRWWTGGKSGHEVARGNEDPRLILNRPWIDAVPEKPTDYMNVFVMIDRQSIGVFQKASQYRLTAELFKHKRDKNSVTLAFPQSGKQAKVTYRVWECDDLDGMDLCLELSQNPWGGPKRYHSARDWERGQLGPIQARALEAVNLPTL